MELTLSFIGVSAVFELLLWLQVAWPLRKAVACVIIMLVSIGSGLIFGLHPSAWAGLLLIIGVYRVINLLRIVEGRTNADYLYVVSRKTSFWLLGLSLLVLTGAALDSTLKPAAITLWYAVAAIQLALGFELWSSTRRNLRTTRPPIIEHPVPDRELPSLTVAIPARNETEDLEHCLESLIASGYPKLEILVLDDCSQNKRTPEIIRSFAHDGCAVYCG